MGRGSVSGMLCVLSLGGKKNVNDSSGNKKTLSTHAKDSAHKFALRGEVSLRQEIIAVRGPENRDLTSQKEYHFERRE